MKKLLLMSVLSISPLPGLAGQAENGIYERSQDTSVALVRAPHTGAWPIASAKNTRR